MWLNVAYRDVRVRNDNNKRLFRRTVYRDIVTVVYTQTVN